MEGLLHELPCEIKEKLSDSEEQDFKDHSKSLKIYMSQLNLDVNVVMSIFSYELNILPLELRNLGLSPCEWQTFFLTENYDSVVT